VCEKKRNPKPCPRVGLGFIPSKKFPKWDVLDGALVSVRSLKPHHLSFHMAQVGPLQMPSTKHWETL